MNCLVFRTAITAPRPYFVGTTMKLFSSKIEVGTIHEIKEGARKLIETNSGIVIVTKQKGSFYAVNAKCPHLGVSMKNAKIGIEDDGIPIITCTIHNSKFSLEDGSCKGWCQGLLGIPGTGFIGAVASNVGNKENTPAIVYKVSIDGDKLYIDV